MADHGLGKELFVIHTIPEAPTDEIMAVLPEHLEYQFKLERDGIMFGAGPIFDDQGANQGGQIIYRATSFDEARKIADADPMHSKGVRSYTIHRWVLNEGTVSIRVDFSTQKMTIE